MLIEKLSEPGILIYKWAPSSFDKIMADIFCYAGLKYDCMIPYAHTDLLLTVSSVIDIFYKLVQRFAPQV